MANVSVTDSSTQAVPITKIKSLIYVTSVIVTLLIIMSYHFPPILYLSSSISRLDSLSDSCLHRASLRSISL